MNDEFWRCGKMAFLLVLGAVTPVQAQNLKHARKVPSLVADTKSTAEAKPGKIQSSAGRTTSAVEAEVKQNIRANAAKQNTQVDEKDLAAGELQGIAQQEHSDEKSAELQANSAKIAGAGALALDVATKDGIIVIDDDECDQTTTYAEEPLPLDSGGSKIKAGARFPVVLTSQLNSKTAKTGDLVRAVLKYDLKIGPKVIANKGAEVRGHLDYVQKARTPVACSVSRHRWTMTSGCLGVKFDEIINQTGEHFKLVAEPARQALVVKNKSEGRVLGINHKGQIAAPYSMQVRYNAVRMGLNVAAAPLGVFSFGAMPVALGVLGAVNPSFAFGKPIGENVRHRRIKGFFWGALSGVPGSFLIEGTTVKGEEVILKPGDEFLAEMQQEFAAEPITAAELMPSASTQLHGKVLNAPKKH